MDEKGTRTMPLVFPDDDAVAMVAHPPSTVLVPSIVTVKTHAVDAAE